MGAYAFYVHISIFLLVFKKCYLFEIFVVVIHRHYCDNETTSEEAMLNAKKCPAGRFCLAGLHDEPSATDCSTGHYCEEGKLS